MSFYAAPKSDGFRPDSAIPVPISCYLVSFNFNIFNIFNVAYL